MISDWDSQALIEMNNQIGFFFFLEEEEVYLVSPFLRDMDDTNLLFVYFLFFEFKTKISLDFHRG